MGRRNLHRRRHRDAGRALDLPTLQTAMPAPKDPARCRNLDPLPKTLATNRDRNQALDAWTGWRPVGRGMLKGCAWLQERNKHKSCDRE